MGSVASLTEVPDFDQHGQHGHHVPHLFAPNARAYDDAESRSQNVGEIMVRLWQIRVV
jgi:hypothetical protein